MTTLLLRPGRLTPADGSLHRCVRLVRVPHAVAVVDAFHVDLSHGDLLARFHDDMVLCAVVKGEAQLRVGDETLALGGRSVVAISAGTVYSLAASSLRRGTLVMVHYGTARAPSAPGAGVERDDRASWGAAHLDDERLARRLRALFDGDASLAAPAAASFLLAEACSRVGGASATGPTPTISEAVQRVRCLLDSHFASRLRILQIADTLQMSACQLIRRFSRAVGMPPHAYLRQVRVNRALALIRAGEPISGAAYRCGFSDQSHLTRTFKQLVGVPPGAYARAGRPAVDVDVALTG